MGGHRGQQGVAAVSGHFDDLLHFQCPGVSLKGSQQPSPTGAERVDISLCRPPSADPVREGTMVPGLVMVIPRTCTVHQVKVYQSGGLLGGGERMIAFLHA